MEVRSQAPEDRVPPEAGWPRRPWRLAAAALLVVFTILAGFGGQPASAEASRPPPEQVLRTWYDLILELVRHTPTYSPPVASRSFAYVGVAVYEAAASGSRNLQSLAGQLNGLLPPPVRVASDAYDEGVIVQAVVAAAVRNLFSNTGPTGQRAMARLEARLAAAVSAGLPPDVVARSEAYGKAVAVHVITWSQDDGGARIENMGFPLDYRLTPGPAHWVPTSVIRQQQAPLLPDWGRNRPFAMPDGAACPLPPPPEYSEDPASQFYREALEVYETVRAVTPEQVDIARFWSDDPMLSPTPPGHWISIALQILERDRAGLERSAEVLALVGIAVADSFIGCWHAKYQYDLVRPVTYIRRLIDQKWEPILITPPFPEYPSGHSTQSGAAATVFTHLFGDNFAFVDATRESDGVRPRSYASFWEAAGEAGISRLYGGIHYRAAIELGLDQGRCIGAYTTALRVRR